VVRIIVSAHDDGPGAVPDGPGAVPDGPGAVPDGPAWPRSAQAPRGEAG